MPRTIAESPPMRLPLIIERFSSEMGSGTGAERTEMVSARIQVGTPTANFMLNELV